MSVPKDCGFVVHDAGHFYTLGALDGYQTQYLRFVKRFDRDDPSKYPGNKGAYSGTTLQIVLRVLLNRVKYLQGQKWCVENVMIRLCLMLAIWLLEFRAARRHGRGYWHGLDFASHQHLCEQCGHTVCEHS
ncbi:hypothetical protein SAMN05216428_102359 [Nitrosospira sp. Nsp11]|nr:hypothetical protein SAMN05216428_102359 [Nitrosospira sp. Nsp11]